MYVFQSDVWPFDPKSSFSFFLIKQKDMNSFLWTVKRPPPYAPSYLFGTIHVPYTRVWDYIPDSSKRAFQSSTNVFFELDLTDPITISKLTSCQLLPNGENLQTLLPRDLYRRLKRHLDYVKHMMPFWMTADQRGRGLYADYLFNAIAGNWERKRPVWVMLMVNSLTEADVRSRGTPVLDLFLAQEAERLGKQTGAVERVEEQCHPLNGLNFSQVSEQASRQRVPCVCFGKSAWEIRWLKKRCYRLSDYEYPQRNRAGRKWDKSLTQRLALNQSGRESSCQADRLEWKSMLNKMYEV